MIDESVRVLDWTLPDPAGNLALDETLLDAGQPVLRFWESPVLVVVLGRSGKADEEVHSAACETDGVPVIRRSSGGGTVVLGPGCLNYSLVLPLDEGLRDVNRSYERILGPLAEAFGADYCPPGDLAVGGRKISGTAQRRTRTTLLHHGTLLYDFDRSLLTRYLREPRRQPVWRNGRRHEDFAGNLPLSAIQIKRKLRKALAGGTGRLSLNGDGVFCFLTKS